MAGAVSLSGKIQKCLNDELNGDNVETICQLLKSTKGLGYRRRIVEDIGRKPLKLYDEMLRRGDIKETNYSLLLRILKEADLTDCVQEIEEIIEEHKQQNAPRGNQFTRPNDLSIKRTSQPLSSPEFPSPADCKRGRFASSSGRSGSEDSVFPDHGNYRKFYLRNKDDYYPFEENRKGLVAIINNFTNEKRDGIRFRKGTIEDQKEIVKFFKSGKFAHLYDVEEPGLNLGYEEFDQFLDNLATKLKLGKDSYHSFFLFILSHGDEDGLQMYCSSSEEPRVMAIDKITSKFSDCLRDYPKVFVIQACQGRYDNQVQSVVGDATTPGDANNQPNDSEENMETESVDGDEICIETGPPDAADMLTAFATVKGYKSYRVKNGLGSWFIQKLFKELKEAHKEDYYSSHLLDLLTKVQDIVSKKQGKVTPDGREPGNNIYVKQMPCFQSSLRKKFYLLPPSLP